MGWAEREIILEAGQLLGTQAPMILGGALVALGAIAAEPWLAGWRSERGRSWLRRCLVLVAAGLGLFLASKVLWLADDAFISFRYARNLANGLGLVFNEGEWVEGYTNFLWTALLGGVAWLGVDVPTAALVGNLLCFVSSLAVVSALVRRIAPGPVVIPFSAIALAVLTPFHTFASSGLETMPLALLIVSAMLASTRERGGALLAGTLLVAAALTRPDQLLIYGCMGLALLLEGPIYGAGVNWRRLISFAAPLFLIFAPYFLIRWSVYGDLLPNTYYAKSGGLSYYKQGAVYLVHFLATSGAWLWLPLFVLTSLHLPRTPSEGRLRLFTLFASVLYGLYVVRVGGDFMEHRFFVPLLPLLAAAIEISSRSLVEQLGKGWLGRAAMFAAAASLAVAATPIRLIAPFEKRWHLAAEHTFYPVLGLAPLEVGGGFGAEGKRLRRLFDGVGVRPAVALDAIGLFSYYSELPVIDTFGLTNRRIAHKPVSFRGRPGHEKIGTVRELLEEGAILSLRPAWGERFRKETEARVDGAVFYFIRSDPALEEKLAAIPGARIPNPRRGVRRLLGEGSRAEMVEALPFYQAYTVAREDGPELVRALQERLREVADFEGDLPAGAIGSGEALELRWGTPPQGGSGRGWLSSMGDRGGGKGSLVIPLGTLDGSELRFALGGAASGGVAVRLLLGDEVAHEARPSGAPGMASFSWSLERWRGEEASLEIVDDDPARGVGLMIDGIHFAPAQGDIRERIERWAQGGSGDPALLLREVERTLARGDPAYAPLEQALLARWTFDDPVFSSELEVGGSAFGQGPIAGALERQQPVHGWHGAGYLSSFHGGDEAMGRIALPWMQLGEERISFLVGGGGDCTKTFVGLEVEGEIVARRCGRGDERLRPETIETAPWKGERGRLVLVDRSKGPWGHLLVDDIIVVHPNARREFGASSASRALELGGRRPSP